MAVNTALRAKRLALGLSQHDFARAVRYAGEELGVPNNCDKRRVQLWEAGKVGRPHGRYVLALERVTGEPATNLGFESAAERYGLDPGEAMSTTGPWIPLPDPKAAPGPLTGIWLSEYEYESTGRNASFRNRHYVVLIQHGNRVQARSTPGSTSRVKIDMTVNGQVLTGTWSEETSPDGYYRGAVYHGAIQMLGDPAGQRITGQWVGFGKGSEINTGQWNLERVTRSAAQDDIDVYSRPPGDS